ncbi:M15 family metallopeptidase [Lachnospiraceae bacterium 45-W7]
MRDMTKLHPRLQKMAIQLQQECSRQGIFIKFSECLRTIAEQDALYAQGRTAPGNIVTNAKGSTYSSQHQWGVAIDFYIDMDVDGDGDKKDDAFNNSTRLFDRVGTIAKSIGLGWGGDWTSIKDRPHLYLPDWGSTTSRLKQLYKSPDHFMASWKNPDLPQSPGYTPKPSDTPVKNTAAVYTKKQFILDVQSCTGSKPDGIAGKETIGNTVTISAWKNRKHPVVTPVQKRLNTLGFHCGTADGIAGPKFTAAVNHYQSNVLKYRTSDGEITAGKKMWKSLLGMI